MKIRIYDCLAESQSLGLLVWRNAPPQIIQAWEGCPVKNGTGTANSELDVIRVVDKALFSSGTEWKTQRRKVGHSQPANEND